MVAKSTACISSEENFSRNKTFDEEIDMKITLDRRT